MPAPPAFSSSRSRPSRFFRSSAARWKAVRNAAERRAARRARRTAEHRLRARRRVALEPDWTSGPARGPARRHPPNRSAQRHARPIRQGRSRERAPGVRRPRRRRRDADPGPGRGANAEGTVDERARAAAGARRVRARSVDRGRQHPAQCLPRHLRQPVEGAAVVFGAGHRHRQHPRRRRSDDRDGRLVPLRPRRHGRFPPARGGSHGLRGHRADGAVADAAARRGRTMGAQPDAMTRRPDPADPVTLGAATLQWFNDHAADGIFTTDVELRIRSWNQWLQTATGIASTAAVGRALFDVLPALKERGFDQYYAEALRGEVKVLSHALHRHVISRARLASGEPMPQSGRIAPLVQGGVIVGTITVVVDVSERVATERELRAQIATAEEARQMAEEASRVKDEFLATLSHEIRTPLNAVLGWTRILRSRTPDAAMLARAIDVIDRNASAQLTLVSDMLDMARITAGKVRLELRDVDLAATIASSLDVIRPAADAKGIEVSTDLPAGLLRVRGDEDRLLQVFWNLLSNAVKFTDAGGHISLRLA